MHHHYPLFFRTDTLVAIASMLVIAAIFGSIYASATRPQPLPSFIAQIKNATLTPSSPFVLPTVVHKLIHKNGWHPCAEDAGVWCKGPYVINETLLKIPMPGPNGTQTGPPQYIFPPQP